MKQTQAKHERSVFSFPTKTIFGPGALQELPERLHELKIRKPLLVTDPGVAATPAFASLLGVLQKRCPLFACVHGNPILEDVEAAARAFRISGADAVIGFGGGSPLDVAKIIRLRIKRPRKALLDFDPAADWSGLAPFIAIPTTAGTGSEAGRSSVITVNGRKEVFFHPSLLAGLVILDPELTVGLPPLLTAATGADALTHCIESYTSPRFHPLCDGVALEGLHLVSGALVRAVRDGNDVEARGRMQLAAMMGGIAFQKDLGVAHSLAHPLSAICRLHHGTANALTLPASMEFNASRKPGLYRRVGVALGLPDPDDAETIAFVRSLLEEIGLPPGLREHGVRSSDLPKLVEQAWMDPCHRTNPVPVTKKDLQKLYEKSF